MEASNLRREIVESHINLVWKEVRGVMRRTSIKSYMDADDLHSEGILGLYHALDKFDPSRGFKFYTYAVWWVRAFIIRAAKASVVSTSNNTKMPVYVYLDAPVGDTKGERYEIFEHDKQPTPETMMLEKEKREVFGELRRRAQELLPVNTVNAVAMLYDEEKTMVEAAELVGVIKQRIHQHKTQYIKKIRKVAEWRRAV